MRSVVFVFIMAMMLLCFGMFIRSIYGAFTHECHWFFCVASFFAVCVFFEIGNWVRER